jgi:hypothetical protein
MQFESRVKEKSLNKSDVEVREKENSLNKSKEVDSRMKEKSLLQDEKDHLFSHLKDGNSKVEEVPDLKESLKTRIMLTILFVILIMSLILSNFGVILPLF